MKNILFNFIVQYYTLLQHKRHLTVQEDDDITSDKAVYSKLKFYGVQKSTNMTGSHSRNACMHDMPSHAIVSHISQ